MKSSHSLKGVSKKFYSVLRGAQKVSDPQFSHFVAPLPVINDHSLTSLDHHIISQHGPYAI